MTETVHEDFLTRLRVEVADAARRVDDRALTGSAGRSPARDRRWLSAAAVLLVAALLGGVYLAGARPQPSAVQVERQGADWVFRWDEPGPDAEEVERAAQEVGLSLQVEEQPAAPYSVGRVHGWSSDGPVVVNLPLEATDDRAAGWGFRLPAGHPGNLTVTIGRPPRDGEPWAISQDATAPGGLLECQPLLGQPLGRTLEALEGTGVRIDGFAGMQDSGAPERDLTLDDLYPYAGTEVVTINQTGPDALWITVTSGPISDDFRPPPVVGC